MLLPNTVLPLSKKYGRMAHGNAWPFHDLPSVWRGSIGTVKAWGVLSMYRADVGLYDNYTRTMTVTRPYPVTKLCFDFCSGFSKEHSSGPGSFSLHYIKAVFYHKCHSTNDNFPHHCDVPSASYRNMAALI